MRTSAVAVAVAAAVLLCCSLNSVDAAGSEDIPEFANNPTYEQVLGRAIAEQIDTPIEELNKIFASSGADKSKVGSGAVVRPASVREYFTPTPADSVRIPAGTTGFKVVNWGSLSQDHVRALLDQSDEKMELLEVTASGELKAVPLTATLERKTYQLNYHYFRYRTQSCEVKNPMAGGIAMGVGLRITANISVQKAGANVGGMMGLSAAVQEGRVKGSLRVQSVGISSGKASISAYLASGVKDLSPDSIQNVIESFAVVKAVSETPATVLSPNYLFVESVDNDACIAKVSS